MTFTEKDCQKNRHDYQEKITSVLFKIENKLEKMMIELAKNGERTNNIRFDLNSHVNNETGNIKILNDKLEEILKDKVSMSLFKWIVISLATIATAMFTYINLQQEKMLDKQNLMSYDLVGIKKTLELSQIENED